MSSFKSSFASASGGLPALASAMALLACAGERAESATTSSEALVGPKAKIPPALTALVGRYEGTGMSFRWDGKTMVPASSWTEVVVTRDPVVEAKVAYVTANDTMTFDGGYVMNLSWTEGFLRNRDGSLGTRYFDVMGARVLEIEVAPQVWSMRRENSIEDLRRFGFADPVRGFTITTKTVAFEDGAETDRLTAVSDIVWRDPAGAEHRGHFVTMSGFHRRVAAPERSNP